MIITVYLFMFMCVFRLVAEHTLTVRMTIHVFISLLRLHSHSKALKDGARSIAIDVQKVIQQDVGVRVRADAYCLLARLVTTYQCDKLMYDFGVSQLLALSEFDAEQDQLEVDMSTGTTIQCVRFDS